LTINGHFIDAQTRLSTVTMQMENSSNLNLKNSTQQIVSHSDVQLVF